MTNIDRLTQHITKYGTEGILIHTVPETNSWLICQKIDDDKWLLALGKPLGNTTYNLGTVTDLQHVAIWQDLTKRKIEQNTNQHTEAKEFKDFVFNLKKTYANKNIYKKFTKINQKNTKRNRTKLRKKHKRSKRPTK